MGYKKIPKTIPEKQALAAIGQGALLHLYEKLFAEYGKTVAQVLITRAILMNEFVILMLPMLFGHPVYESDSYY